MSTATDILISVYLHRSGFTVAEVEPLGVYQFAPDSRKLVIAEDIQTITLYVQRLYGSRSNTTRLSYKTVAGSAAAGEDYVSVPDGRLVFNSPRQTNTSFRLSILDDSLSEPDEYFHVNLTDVQVLTQDLVWAEASPRLNPQHSLATVTILASDVTGGVLSIGPGLVQVSEDRDEETQQERRVVLRVRRSDSVAGDVRVRVQAYGGVCLFCSTALMLQCTILYFVILMSTLALYCCVILPRWKYRTSSLHSGTCWDPCKGARGLPLAVHHSVPAGWSE